MSSYEKDNKLNDTDLENILRGFGYTKFITSETVNDYTMPSTRTTKYCSYTFSSEEKDTLSKLGCSFSSSTGTDNIDIVYKDETKIGPKDIEKLLGYDL